MIHDCVVVVDDEAELLEMVCTVLETQGYPAVGVSDCESTLGLDPSVSPSLFLIDLMLPRVDGIELARALRDNGYRSTPMVAMSASRLTARFARTAGIFDAVLEKPFDLEALLRCVELYTSRARASNA